MTYRLNNRTTGLHTTTPGWGMPSCGGLQEYCTISSRGQSCRLTGAPLRRFSWKLRDTMLVCSGRDSAEKMGTRGAIFPFECNLIVVEKGSATLWWPVNMESSATAKAKGGVPSNYIRVFMFMNKIRKSCLKCIPLL